MFTSNPFAALSASISPGVMQTYIVVMVILTTMGAPPALKWSLGRHRENRAR